MSTTCFRCVHKPIARVVIVPVAFVVHARPAVIELPPITEMFSKAHWH